MLLLLLLLLGCCWSHSLGDEFSSKSGFNTPRSPYSILMFLNLFKNELEEGKLNQNLPK
jgi:hypothetical protein